MRDQYRRIDIDQDRAVPGSIVYVLLCGVLASLL